MLRPVNDVPPTGWSGLFADLESQFDAAQAAELAAEVGERTRQELARASVLDRLRGNLSGPVTLGLHGVGTVHGVLTGCGPDWCLLSEAAGEEAVVVLAAVLWVRGLTNAAVPAGLIGPVAARWHLGLALRALARERSPVRLMLRDGSAVTGTPDRVGADYLEIAEHPLEELRRARNLTAGRLVPFAALAAVRRR